MDDDSSDQLPRARKQFRIEVDFMDKLANKSYLRYLHDDPAGVGSSSDAGSASAAGTAAIEAPRRRSRSRCRPKGVPDTLRLLSVDTFVELRRRGFDNGSCRVAADRAYLDGVAEAKPVALLLPKKQQKKGGVENGGDHDGDGDGSSTQDRDGRGRRRRSDKKRSDSSKDNAATAILEVDQKVWVQSLFECYASSSNGLVPGVQVMEADTRSLNPKNLRRNYTFAAASSKKTKQRDNNNETDSSIINASSGSELDPKIEQELVADAPWHQYAWFEEMELRVGGIVPFGQPLRRASWWDRWLYGHAYSHRPERRRRSSMRTWLWRPWSSLGDWWQSSPSWQGSGDGSDDGSRYNIDNKPHAVIANRARMQRVPHALRRLDATCRRYNVPLFLINSDDDDNGSEFDSVLRQVRTSVKQTVILQSMQQSPSFWGYRWGRFVGRAETDARWRANQLSKQVSEASEAIKRKKKSSGSVESWSNLDSFELEKALAERGVARRDKKRGAGDATTAECNEALSSLSRRCLGRDSKKDDVSAAERTRAGEAPTASSL